jgi:prepilin-type N-terminal cleavage/methylation domain-containing protein
MVLHKTYIRNIRVCTGFTLIEVIVVMSIVALLAAVTLSTDLGGYRSYSFDDEEHALIAATQESRSDAMNNVCFGNNCTTGASHSIHFEAHSYTLFQGDNYDSNNPENEIIEVNPTVTISGISDVVFHVLSGDASATPANMGDVVLTDTTGHIATTTIYSVGQISWTQ